MIELTAIKIKGGIDFWSQERYQQIEMINAEGVRHNIETLNGNTYVNANKRRTKLIPAHKQSCPCK